MQDPLISVIIPTYNRAPFIGGTVDSVLAQTLGSLEVVVVDDGSTDGTTELVRSRYAAEPRVRCVWQDNAERSVARNTGIRMARGGWLAFLDSDDQWRPDKLAKQMAVLESDPSFIMVHCAYSRIDESAGVSEDVVIPDGEGLVSGNIFWSLIEANPVSSATPVIRRAVVERCGGFTLNPRLLCFEDWDLWTRVAYHGRVAYVPEPLAIHRIHPGNTERPVTGAVYRQFIASMLGTVGRSDAMRVRDVAAGRFMELLCAAMRDSGVAAGRRELREGLCGVGWRFLWRILGDRWLLAELLLGRSLGRRALRLYAHGLYSARSVRRQGRRGATRTEGAA